MVAMLSRLLLPTTCCSRLEKVASCSTNWVESIGESGSWLRTWAVSSWMKLMNSSPKRSGETTGSLATPDCCWLVACVLLAADTVLMGPTF